MSNLRKLPKQSAFSLIELMIVVAIIAIVATMAMVSYLRNIASAQVSEAVTLLSGARSAIDDAITQEGEFPTDAEFDNLGVRQSGKYVDDIEVNKAVFTLTATFNNESSGSISGLNLVFQRNAVSGEWNCKITPSTIPDWAIPKVCD
ncbi:MAG: prepilin-type N-terminal cleavage/methylation domain-containing protein [Gammaproteobacteria bacterium]|nr:prepilin-type N-terminal cleavage/methylation domain-containing protein [Gammaproteobacteria bacterium]